MADEKMRMAFVEGSPEQLADFAKSMGMSMGVTVAPPVAVAASAADAPTDGNDIIVTKEFTIAALTRIGLAAEQVKILVELKKAFPKEVIATDLQKAIKYSSSQFSGLMGAFGRRISHTPGYNDNAWFFIKRWDADAGCYHYRIPRTVKEALDELKIG